MTELTATLKAAQKSLSSGRPIEALSVIQNCLASAPLALPVLTAIDRLIVNIATNPEFAAQVPQRRIAVICGALSSAILIRTIRCSLAAQGYVTTIYEGEYNNYQIDVLDSNSALYAFRPDAIVLAVGFRDTAVEILWETSDEVDDLVTREVANFRHIWQTIGDRLGVPVIQHLFDRPDVLMSGVAERRLSRSPWLYIEKLNRALIDAAPGFVSWLDLDALAINIGLANWHSRRDYFLSKMPFGMTAVPHYSTAFGAVHRLISAKPLKALVLDLDNTLWGGVIGDDGLEGIRFGAGSAEGEAYLSFCRYLKALHHRGILLAVSSKNDPALPKQLFRERTDMPLKLEDFSAFSCNWNDKATNIRGIARELNLGLDALVFVDDNAAECALVARELPEVTVVSLPESPSDFVTFLDRQHLFDSQGITEADTLRAASYQALRAAEKLKTSATDIDAFLSSLDMVGNIRRARAGEIGRLAQMEGKTNQFNMTTRRYRADTLTQLSERSDAMVVSFSLDDRFASHGLVGSLVAIRDGETLRIDNWLLSCRVFSRGVEAFMMRWLMDEARKMGVQKIRGEYLATARNGVVADLYNKLGFASDDKDGRWWTLDLGDHDLSCLSTFIGFAGSRDQNIGKAEASTTQPSIEVGTTA